MGWDGPSPFPAVLTVRPFSVVARLLLGIMEIVALSASPTLAVRKENEICVEGHAPQFVVAQSDDFFYVALNDRNQLRSLCFLAWQFCEMFVNLEHEY